MIFYLDTSVFGGYFDAEFRQDTLALFELIQQENIEVLYSGIIASELASAPSKVANLLDQLPRVRSLALNDEILSLSSLYIKEGALEIRSYNDAQHIALATIGGASALIIRPEK